MEFFHGSTRLEDHGGVREDDAVVLGAVLRVLFAVVDSSSPHSLARPRLGFDDGTTRPERRAEAEAALQVVRIAVQQVPRPQEVQEEGVKEDEKAAAEASVGTEGCDYLLTIP